MRKIGPGYKTQLRAESRRLIEAGTDKAEIRKKLEDWKAEYWRR